MNIKSGTISWINPWYNCSLYMWNSFSKTLFIKKWKKWFLQSYLSPLMLSVRISIRARCTTLCDKVCQWLTTGRWFSFQFFFPSDWLIELINFYFIHNLLTILVLSPVFFPSYFQDTYIIRIRTCISLECLFFFYFSWWVFIRVNIFISYDIHVVSCIYG
jgi:hypothetical protein